MNIDFLSIGNLLLPSHLILAGAIVLTLYLAVTFIYKSSYFTIYTGNSFTTAKVLMQCNFLTSVKYRPPFFLTSGLSQMLYYCLEFSFPKIFKLPFPPVTKEDFIYSDGGYSIIATCYVPEAQNKPKLIIFPGFTGSSTDVYVRKACFAVIAQGFQPIIVNYRGCGGAKLTTPKLCSFANHSDINEVIKHIKETHKGCKLYGLGVSQGASLLTMYLKQNADGLIGAVCIACPFDLYECDSLCSTIVQYLYGRLARSLVQRNAKELKIEKLTNEKPEDYIKSIKTARDFNIKYTLKTLSYNDLEEYLKAESCCRYLSMVKVPTLYISSLDDPVIPKSCIPYQTFKNSQNLILATLPFGGHTNFYHGFKPTQFFPQIVAQFLNAINTII